MIPNKMTTPHLEHNITIKRADPSSPHYGYYYCNTCKKFMTWTDKKTYNNYKKTQLNSGIMWFGTYQGTPMSEVPSNYLQWAVDTFLPTTKGYDLLVKEYDKRKHHPM